MKTYQQWMHAYGLDHTHPTNILIHKVCVPLILFSIIGLIWSIPSLEISSYSLNWTIILLLPVLLFYWSLKNSLMFFLMILQFFVIIFFCMIIEEQYPLRTISLWIFVLAWIGQFIGHKIEGRKPSFLQDLSFLLIGPLWVNRSFLKTLGIKDSHG